MSSGYDVHEDAYDEHDAEENYYDIHEGHEELSDDIDDEGDGDYVPSRRGVDDDDEEDEDEYEEEDLDEDLDRQLDAEDAAEAMEELHTLAEADQESERTTIAQLLQTLMTTAGLNAVPSGDDTVHIENITADNLNRVLSLIRTTVGGVRVLSGSSAHNQQIQSDEEEPRSGEEEQPLPPRRSTRLRAQGAPYARSGPPNSSWWRKAYTEPQKVGQELLLSGEFGEIRPKERYMGLRSQNLARLIRDRMANVRPISKESLCESLVPNSHGTVVASYPGNVYCGQFSFDSSFYYVCCRDFNLHIYDMTAPRTRSDRPESILYDRTTGHRTTMKVHKSIRGVAEGWTVTDSHLSPNNERMIYSSMGSAVYMVKTLDYDNTQTPIYFSDRRRNRSLWDGDGDDYYIWSCRFSADGNEIIAGGRGSIYVYDLLASRRTVKIQAHRDDVNSCCWADTGSNVLVSASDDTFIKVWDRRSLGSSPKPSGILIGHTEGITNVSAKGDGRYVISNGKDQALRLWDLRKMRTNQEYESVYRDRYGLPDFDYRYADRRKQSRPAHPNDCSIMTYRGHMVMRTLIRCHFSPEESTGGAYIYSGSTDGRIHIWSLDGRVVQVLDRAKTMGISFDPSAPELFNKAESKNIHCVRDVSWHSKEPVLLSAAWGEDLSTVARHEWKGLNKMNNKLEDWVEKEESEYIERQRRPFHSSRARFLPGSFDFDDEVDDDEYID